MNFKHLLKTTALTAMLLIGAKVGWGQIATHVVISEIYGGGGNSGAPYKNDYVELYNPTSSPVDISNWSIQYTSATGTTWSSNITSFGATKTIAAKGFFLIKLAGGTTGVDLPTADLTSTINMSGTAGKILLCNNSTAVSAVTDPTDANIVDKVGFGTTANGFETAKAPAPSNTTSIERKANATSTAITLASGGIDYSLGNGWDSDNNSQDFVAQTSLSPQNSLSGIEPDSQAPQATISPANSTTGVSIKSKIIISFDEAIRNIDNSAISDPTSLITFRTPDASGTDVPFTSTIDATKKIIIITPNADLANDQLYYVAFASVEDAINNATSILTTSFRTIDATSPIITSITIDEAAPYYAGNNITVKWYSANVDFVKIEAITPASTLIELKASTDGTDGSEIVSLPSDLSYGTTYKIKVSHVSSSANAESSTFTLIAVTDNLATLVAMTAGDIVKYTGKATITFLQTSNNQKYIQDANAAILIHDPTTAPGYITESYAIENGITNVEGKITLSNGQIQLVPQATTGLKITDGSNPTITPIDRTISTITSADQSKLIRVINWTFANPAQWDATTSKYIVSKNYDIKDIPNTTLVFRTAFTGANYIGTTVPSTPITTDAIAGIFNTQLQFTARDLNDIKSAVATVTSTTYNVNDVAGTITNIPFSTTLTTFKGKITPAAGATFDVFDDAAGTTAATKLDDTKFVVVTAADDITKKSYTITRNAVLTGNTFTAFSITTTSLHNGVIADPNINVEIGFNEPKNDLVAVFTPSEGATVKIGSTPQESGVTHNDFSATGSLVYTVTAENGDTKDWTVTVTNAAAPLTGNDILTYSIAGVNATVNATLHTVEIAVPFSSNLADLVATFTLSEKATAKIGATTQESGETHNDFTGSGSLTYTITAEDGTPQDWTVTVSKAPASTDATLKDLQYNATTVADFNPSILKYHVTLPFGSSIPTVTASTNNLYASTFITQATDLGGDIAARTATIIVTAESGATQTYSIVFRVDNTEKELFFSEYVEGSSNNKAIEIYNPNSTAVDLSAYTIKISTNGLGFGKNSTGVSPNCSLPLSGTLAANDVYIIYNWEAAATGITSVGDLKIEYKNATTVGSSIASFNGNDALALYKGADLIDVFGIEITTITTGFDVAGTAAATANHTIIRKPTVTKGNIDWTTSAGTTVDNSEWIVKEIDYFTNLGSHNMFLPAPATTTDKNTLPSFGNIVSGTVGSGELSFIVGGVYLSSNIVITAPAGFEISTQSGANFVSSSPISLTPVNGIVAPDTIFVKFHPMAIQAYTGNITIENDEVTAKIVAVSGTGVASDGVAPLFIIEYPKFGNIGPYTLDVLVKTDEQGFVYFHKVLKDATAPSAADIKSLGTRINILVPNTEYSANVTDLTDDTEYDFYFIAEDNQATPNTSSVEKKQVTTATIPVKTIALIQTPTDGTQNSPSVDQYVTTSGIVSALKNGANGQEGFYIQDAAGAWNGIYVHTTDAVSITQSVTVTGKIVEYYEKTEISPVTKLVKGSTGNTPYAPATVTTLNANDEKYEGVLVKVSNATCTITTVNSVTTIKVDDTSGPLVVYKGLFADLSIVNAKKYDIVGIIEDYKPATGSKYYELLPRGLGDITEITTGIDDNFNSSLTVYPNPFTNEIRFNGAENVKHVVITNITGQVIKNEAVDLNNKISTSELSNGIYFVTFINDKGEKSTKKMIKQ